ncbi:tripartite tricarboxylate transporter TctB family protein [Polynucleobacter sp. es-MAR-4]|uniref:tripartite tricarboxylate transporter TctB family protein n=1 Tax=Polynucleobacter sp. es-MAR-4 TaxID=1855655 RepID=UPI001C0B975D|nr:tripartite tricarboxylate transporter TctB family protein [Polynucleobacter sp. es-MAR-4]MBU3636909.1 tripartite tricarboxylate transporter TctB family protein [Polynucleobacter sp. es-MAR-4]
MKIRNQRDFGAGIMYMVIGLFFTLVATQYPMGTAAKMGPGYFPFCLGILMTLLGLLILVKSLGAKATIDKIPPFNWKVISIITGSICLFGILLPTMGVLVAIFTLVFVASTASREFSWKAATLNSVVLIGFTYLVFIVGLKLTFPVLPFFIQ